MQIRIDKVIDPVIHKHGVELSLLRLDQIHPHISGNKWYKLKYNLEEMKKQGKKILLTFGGAYSNHIAATAAAGKEYGFKTIGVIRGEELKGDNPTLIFAKECGMQLHFITREQYRDKTEKKFIGHLQEKFGDFYLLPEGGSNSLAVKGCSGITTDCKTDFDYIICAAGTGATLAGIILSMKQRQQAIGIPVLADAQFLEQDIENFMAGKEGSGKSVSGWKLIHDYHFGRYAKTTKELLAFINRFSSHTGIPLDPIYTGKMMYGTYDLITKGYFVKGERVLAVHTGGQG